MEFRLVQVIEGGELTTDIIGAKGGGVVAVVSFLLRVLVLMAARPAMRPFLALDESFAHVSSEYVPNLAQLMRQLVDETGIQILMVTHEPAFGEVADVLYEVSQQNGDSIFTRLKTHQENYVNA